VSSGSEIDSKPFEILSADMEHFLVFGGKCGVAALFKEAAMRAFFVRTRRGGAPLGP
jgi:hypothetical protein